MAVFFRRTLPHSCKVQHKNICLMERRGTDRRVKLKMLGLVSCSQMQQKHAADSSASDRPKLQAASIPGNPTEVALLAAADSLNSYPFVGFDLDLPISKARLPVSVNRTNDGTLQRTTLTVKNKESFSDKTTMAMTMSISHQLCQNGHGIQNVPRSFGNGRKISSKLGLQNYAVYFSNNNFLKQRAGFQRTNSPVRHYATGPRARRKAEKSYYDVLNTTPNATQAQVKEAYFKLSKIYHPDKNKGSKEAQRKFASINEAYSVLGNVTLRKRYDRGTLNQRDVHGEVKPEEKAAEEEMNRDPMYTSSGVPFSVEAKRHAKNMDDFFIKHYKDARDKEQRDRAERKQRMDEYMELQKKAKLSPLVLAVFMLSALAMGIKSVTQNNALKVPGSNKESR